MKTLFFLTSLTETEDGLQPDFLTKSETKIVKNELGEDVEEITKTKRSLPFSTKLADHDGKELHVAAVDDLDEIDQHEDCLKDVDGSPVTSYLGLAFAHPEIAKKACFVMQEVDQEIDGQLVKVTKRLSRADWEALGSPAVKKSDDVAVKILGQPTVGEDGVI